MLNEELIQKIRGLQSQSRTSEEEVQLENLLSIARNRATTQQPQQKYWINAKSRGFRSFG